MRFVPFVLAFGFALFFPSIHAGEINSLIASIKAGKTSPNSIYKPFMSSYFYVIINKGPDSSTIATDDVRLRVIRLRGEPMVVVGESIETLQSFAKLQNYDVSLIRMTGKAIVEGIPYNAGISIMWDDGAFSFPAGLVAELRVGKHR
jgi:hypothetical protein